jgi:hypothetical protein
MTPWCPPVFRCSLASSVARVLATVLLLVSLVGAQDVWVPGPAQLLPAFRQPEVLPGERVREWAFAAGIEEWHPRSETVALTPEIWDAYPARRQPLWTAVLCTAFPFRPERLQSVAFFGDNRTSLPRTRIPQTHLPDCAPRPQQRVMESGAERRSPKRPCGLRMGHGSGE